MNLQQRNSPWKICTHHTLYLVMSTTWEIVSECTCQGRLSWKVGGLPTDKKYTCFSAILELRKIIWKILKSSFHWANGGRFSCIRLRVRQSRKSPPDHDSHAQGQLHWPMRCSASLNSVPLFRIIFTFVLLIWVRFAQDNWIREPVERPKFR